MSHINYITSQNSYQTHSGNGQFSTRKRMATNLELNRAAIQRQEVAASHVHRSWLDNNGLSNIDADELFASAR